MDAYEENMICIVTQSGENTRINQQCRVIFADETEISSQIGSNHAIDLRTIHHLANDKSVENY